MNITELISHVFPARPFSSGASSTPGSFAGKKDRALGGSLLRLNVTLIGLLAVGTAGAQTVLFPYSTITGMTLTEPITFWTTRLVPGPIPGMIGCSWGPPRTPVSPPARQAGNRASRDRAVPMSLFTGRSRRKP